MCLDSEFEARLFVKIYIAYFIPTRLSTSNISNYLLTPPYARTHSDSYIRAYIRTNIHTYPGRKTFCQNLLNWYAEDSPLWTSNILSYEMLFSEGIVVMIRVTSVRLLWHRHPNQMCFCFCFYGNSVVYTHCNFDIQFWWTKWRLQTY